VTWDGNTYLMACAWPLRDLSIEDRAGLLVVAALLARDSDAWARSEVSCLADCGRTRLPEGDSFTVIVASDTADVLPGIRKQVMDRISMLREHRWDRVALEKARDRLRDQFLMPRVPWCEDPATQPYGESQIFRDFLDIRRAWSRIEWRYGDQRNAIGQKVAELTPERVAAVVGKCLAEDGRVSCTVKPGPSPTRK
jgi:hypothetical protein